MSNSISQNLQKLSTDKSDIITALKNKGLDNVDNHGFDNFATDILNITNSYSISDEGKVVHNNELISQTTYPTEITENGTYDTTLNNEVTVDVSNNPTIPLSKGVHCKPISNKYLYDIPYFSRDYSFAPPYISGRDVWTDGTDLYCSTKSRYSYYHYIYDTDSNTWQTISWSGYSYFSGQDVWTDGENIYAANYDSGYQSYSHYTINTSAHTCSYGVPWTGFSNFLGKNVWNYEGNIYCFGYKLNKSTNTWETNSFNVDGQYIWTDGNNLYSSSGYTHMVFDKTTSTWLTKTWNGISDYPLYGYNIWTDGNHIFSSVGSSMMVLDIETSTWKNVNSIYNAITAEGQDVFIYNNNIYVGTNNQVYKLINNHIQSYTTNNYFPYMGT